MNNRSKAYRRGIWAEYVAAAYLTLRGYRILKMRYKTKVGEIDIIARKARSLIFIEVKAHANIDAGLYAVTPRTQKRIARAAQDFMVRRKKYIHDDMRFDVISIKLWGVCPRKVLHLDNAWRIDSY